jgi:hypothetical protein
VQPSEQPTEQPTGQPSQIPSGLPTGEPSGQPSRRPSSLPSSEPSAPPSCVPTGVPTGTPSDHPSSQPSEQPSAEPTETASPTLALVSYINSYIANGDTKALTVEDVYIYELPGWIEKKDFENQNSLSFRSEVYVNTADSYLDTAVRTRSGLVVLAGKTRISGVYHAFAVFVDQCGQFRTATTVHIPTNADNHFTAVMSFDDQHIELVGNGVYDYTRIILISECDAKGKYLATYGMKWLTHAYYSDAILLNSGNQKVYVGALGEIGVYDVLVASFGLSGEPQWAFQFIGPKGEDKATAACDCGFGVIVVGVHNNGRDGFLMVLDAAEGNMLDEKSASLAGANFLQVKCTESGGYAIAGSISVGDREYGLLALGNEHNAISDLIQITWVESTEAVICTSLEEMSPGRFAVTFDVMERGYFTSIVAIVNTRGPVYTTTAHYLTIGESPDLIRTQVRSTMRSPKGGYNIAGSTKKTGMPISYYFAELTAGLDFPGYDRYSNIPQNQFLVTDILATTNISKLDFVVLPVKNSYERLSYLSPVIGSATIETVALNLKDTCVVTNTTQPPTLSPTTRPPTAHPTTAAPSCRPTEEPTTARPTALPTTVAPTVFPTTVAPSKDGDTNLPTAKPTAAPSALPSGVPSAAPSDEPTTAPSGPPTALPSLKPTGSPSTVLPTIPPTSAPSPDPSASPSTSPSGEPSAQPSGLPTGGGTEGHGDDELSSAMIIIIAFSSFLFLEIIFAIWIFITKYFASEVHPAPPQMDNKNVSDVENQRRAPRHLDRVAPEGGATSERSRPQEQSNRQSNQQSRLEKRVSNVSTRSDSFDANADGQGPRRGNRINREENRNNDATALPGRHLAAARRGGHDHDLRSYASSSRSRSRSRSRSSVSSDSTASSYQPDNDYPDEESIGVGDSEYSTSTSTSTITNTVKTKEISDNDDQYDSATRKAKTTRY